MTSLNTHEPMPTREEGSPEVWPQVLADLDKLRPAYAMVDHVKEDMQERDRIGWERYGGPLVVQDGRDALIDMYQELLDGIVYSKKQILRGELSEQDQGLLEYTYRTLINSSMLIRSMIQKYGRDAKGGNE